MPLSKHQIVKSKQIKNNVCNLYLVYKSNKRYATNVVIIKLIFIFSFNYLF